MTDTHDDRPLVRIEADGYPRGTRIFDAEGNDITKHVTAITWRHEAGAIPKAEVTLALFPVEVSGRATVLGFNGKEVRAIEYMDGSEDRFDGLVRATSMDGHVRLLGPEDDDA